MLRKQKSIDSFCQKNEPKEFSDYGLAKFIQKYKKSSLLFSKRGRMEKFKTETLEMHFLRNKKNLNFQSLDGFVSYKKLKHYRQVRKNQRDIYREIQERYSDWKNYAVDLFNGSVQGVSMTKMWNVSIVGSLIFGMFLMTFIYRYLGPGALAHSNKSKANEATQEVLGASSEKLGGEERNYEDYVAEIMKEYQKDSDNEKKLKDDISEMVDGYPIEKMAPFIAKQDRIVAAFLVAIAKKESDWGKHAPVLDGKDCYNYWGYRGKRERMGTGGHTCFDSPKDAVETVSKRLKFLVSDEKVDTPKDMVVVWKCGYDCSWDNPVAVRKWVSDVDRYFEKFDKFDD
ncbi:MAG TPA: hypothetical protein P5232_02750 [Candidatus Moranbacteria bacterium]|nr:hypothetical protein [Candidatus Moranbacteria bacterium]